MQPLQQVRSTSGRAATVLLIVGGLCLCGCRGPLQEGELAFISYRTQENRLYRTRDQGRTIEPLMPVEVHRNGWSFSPDGRCVAFIGGRKNMGDVFVADVNGANAVRITDSPGNERDVAWSPDGTRLAYVAYRSGNDEILLTPAPPEGGEGRSEVNFSRSDSYDGTPAWSPDGTQLAFASDRESVAAELYLAHVGPREHFRARASQRPAGLRRLTDNTVPDLCPTWSPDGREIAFVSDRPVAGSGFNLYAIEVSSGRERLIFDPPGTLWSPAWSSNGAWICFVGLRGDTRRIGVIRPDGTGLRWVVGNGEDAAYPRWLPLRLVLE